MCRLCIYIGSNINLDLLLEPSNSILKQSLGDPFTPFLEDKNPRDHEINGDGFGLCWRKKKELFFYKSIKPPWNDTNIYSLSKYINSNFYFTHVRAIKPFSSKTSVNEDNCHPFNYKNFIWMHNGDIKNKVLLLNYLHKNCSLDLISNIKGTTDSEYCFYIFLSLLDDEYLNCNKKMSQDLFKDKVIECINLINNISNSESSLNFSIYDGKTLICTRYINSDSDNPPSLYYGKNIILKNNTINNNIIISSEPINTNKSDWTLVQKNKMVIITYNNKIIIKNIEN